MSVMTVPGYRATARPRPKAKSAAYCCSQKEGPAMEGVTHASTGFLLGVGVGVATTAAGLHGVTVADGLGRDLMFGALTAATALLPDADHPDASFAHAAGGLSHGIAHVVGTVMGGHRYGTHSFFGIGLTALLTAAGADWFPNHWALGALAAFLALLITAALRATGFVRHDMTALAWGCGIAALAVVTVRADLWWLVAMGMALHILEDEFTAKGCALFWPVSRRKIGGTKTVARQSRKHPVSSRSSSPRRARAPRVAVVDLDTGERLDTAAPKAQRGPLSMCPACWTGKCDECNGQGCGCPEPRAVHTGRKGAPARQAYVPPELPGTPPF
jgi:membrane-bound metal-dependent hydrolase YbcI (DUF457 family)